jgi:hypothetical protein
MLRGGSNLEPSHQSPIINDHGDTIDDNLHKELNFEHPEHKDTKEDWNTESELGLLV